MHQVKPCTCLRRTWSVWLDTRSSQSSSSLLCLEAWKKVDYRSAWMNLLQCFASSTEKTDSLVDYLWYFLFVPDLSGWMKCEYYHSFCHSFDLSMIDWRCCYYCSATSHLFSGMAYWQRVLLVVQAFLLLEYLSPLILWEPNRVLKSCRDSSERK